MGEAERNPERIFFSDKANALIAADSLISLFLFAVSVQNVDLAVPLLRPCGSPPGTSVFTSLFVGLLIYGAIITAFRSIYTLFKAVDRNDAGRYAVGYHLFVVVLMASTVLIFASAASLWRKVSEHTELPLQPNLGPQEPFVNLVLLLAFFGYVVVVIWKPHWISRLLRKAGIQARRLRIHPEGSDDRRH